jgi:hypothetical protein
MPEGFRLQEEFLDRQEENDLLGTIGSLQFETFQYKGFVAKRRVIAYGWSYDFNSNELSRAEPGPGIPVSGAPEGG